MYAFGLLELDFEIMPMRGAAAVVAAVGVGGKIDSVSHVL
jgi:hypothetical protein